LIEAIRVNLLNTDRKIFITPEVQVPEDGNDRVNLLSLPTSSILEKNDCLVAINATPYEPFRLLKGIKQTAVGVVIPNIC